MSDFSEGNNSKLHSKKFLVALTENSGKFSQIKSACFTGHFNLYLTEILVISAKQHISLPSKEDTLQVLGRNIRMARKRRSWSEQELAGNAGIARSTLQAIEQGKPTVSIGSYYQVLKVMGISNDLASVGMIDEPGRKILDENLFGKDLNSKKSVDYEQTSKNDT